MSRMSRERGQGRLVCLWDVCSQGRIARTCMAATRRGGTLMWSGLHSSRPLHIPTISPWEKCNQTIERWWYYCAIVGRQEHGSSLQTVHSLSGPSVPTPPLSFSPSFLFADQVGTPSWNPVAAAAAHGPPPPPPLSRGGSPSPVVPLCKPTTIAGRCRTNNTESASKSGLGINSIQGAKPKTQSNVVCSLPKGFFLRTKKTVSANSQYLTR
jgi:hypothetical protein